MPKTKTLDQITAMKDKAVRFLRDVVGDADKADDFEAMSPEEYAHHKRVKIENPSSAVIRISKTKGTIMAGLTNTELQARVRELEEENQALNDKLDSILDIAAEDSDDEDEEDDFDSDADDEEDDYPE